MKNVIKVLLVCYLSIVSMTVNAATINGSFGIGGALTATLAPLGADLSDVTAISLSSVFGSAVNGVGDASNVTFFSAGAGGSTVSLAGLVPNVFFTIEGWSFELTSLSIIDQASDLLTLKGAGRLSGNGFDTTDAIWSFSTRSLNSYDMSIETVITAVPVPAAVWLFGSGLLGLVGVARRKA